MNLESTENLSNEEDLEEDTGCMTLDHSTAEDMHVGKDEHSQRMMGDENHLEHQMHDGKFQCLKEGISDDVVVPLDPEPEVDTAKSESVTVHKESHDIDVEDFTRNKQTIDRRLPNAVLPLLRYYQYESSESSSRYMINNWLFTCEIITDYCTYIMRLTLNVLYNIT